MTPEKLAQLTGKFSSKRVIVIGDFFLDKYMEVVPSLAELSFETGKTAHQVVEIRHSPGGAGSIVSNLLSLKAGEVHAIGITGDDGEGYDLRQDLGELGCTTDGLFKVASRPTPTYLKPRDKSVPGLQGEHSRYDIRSRTQTDASTVKNIIAKLDELLPSVDAVIIADYVIEPDCGVITSTVREALAERAVQYPNVIFWVDSRTNVHLFRNIIIKPNQFEAMGIKNPKPGDVVDENILLEEIVRLRSAGGAPVCLTRGASGIIISDPEVAIIPAVHIDGPVDITGAGDSTAAGAVLALASGVSFPEAALVGNIVASITIQQLDTTGTASPEELPPRLELWYSQGNEI
ncbi:bifunctional heptose 7-phosphate kinase/heptose 1-phosphate adenyltransferase [candidate division KSB1 bacterium]